jgi:hypothetical protein
MHEYRQESPTSEGEERSTWVYRVNTVDHPRGLGHGDKPAFARLYHDYRLDIDMEIGSPSTSIQSVEQEYQAYITGMRSDPAVDILKFWEVWI